MGLVWVMEPGFVYLPALLVIAVVIFVGLAWMMGSGFVRLMSNRRVPAMPMSPTGAAEQCRLWMLQPNVRLVRLVLPGTTHMDILAGLLAGPMEPDLVKDAHLAALAMKHQAELRSNDSDFFSFLGAEPAQSDRPRDRGAGRIPACGAVP